MSTRKFWTPFWVAHYLVVMTTMYVRVKLSKALESASKKVAP